MPVLVLVDEELVGDDGDEQRGKGAENSRCCWYCVSVCADIADAGVVQEEGALCRVCCPVDDAQSHNDEEGEKGCAIVLSSEAELPVNVSDAPTGYSSCASSFSVSEAHTGLYAVPAKSCGCRVGFAVHV